MLGNCPVFICNGGIANKFVWEEDSEMVIVGNTGFALWTVLLEKVTTFQRKIQTFLKIK